MKKIVSCTIATALATTNLTTVSADTIKSVTKIDDSINANINEEANSSVDVTIEDIEKIEGSSEEGMVTENNNDSTDLGDEVVETEGIFLNQKHTVKNCRKAYIPQVSLRTNLPEGMDPNEQLYDSMQARMDKQLAAYVKPELDPEIEKQLDDFMLSIGMKQEDIDKI